MTKAELLDRLASAINAPRHDGRHKSIKAAFMALESKLKRPWWKREVKDEGR